MNQPRSPGSWWLGLSLRFAATRPGAWALSRILPRVEAGIEMVSGSRVTFAELLDWFGAPIVELTTIGAKTGTLRTVPVLGVPDEGDWVVAASNWGRDHHPAWYHNLKTNPIVQVTYRNQSETYEAHEVTGAERHQYWDTLTRINPGLPTYQRRAEGREIPVVVLAPAPAGTTLDDQVE